MADEKDGGTPEPKSYNEEEVKALIDAANKEGAVKSWTHFQGVADKQIAEAKSEGSAREAELTGTINSMKAAHIESLPEDQQTAAMVKELYKDQAGAKTSAPAPDSKVTIRESEVGDSEKQLQEAIGNHLKDLGLDPSKVSWGNSQDGNENLKTFLGSVVDQVKAGKSAEDNKDDDPKDNPDTKTVENNVDTSRGAGKSADITQIDPLELISSAKWAPIRGMEE